MSTSVSGAEGQPSLAFAARPAVVTGVSERIVVGVGRFRARRRPFTS